MFLGAVKFVSCVPDDNSNHQDKDDNIEDQDGKDGSKEGTKEYCRVGDEAAAGKNENTTL